MSLGECCIIQEISSLFCCKGEDIAHSVWTATREASPRGEFLERKRSEEEIIPYLPLPRRGKEREI